MLNRINPCSSYHFKAREAFSKNLTRGQKIAAVILTILASPFFIVGGIATFATAVNFFKNRNIALLPKKEAKAAKVEEVAKKEFQKPKEDEMKSELQSLVTCAEMSNDYMDFRDALEELFRISLKSDLNGYDKEIQTIMNYYRRSGKRSYVSIREGQGDQFIDFMKKCNSEYDIRCTKNTISVRFMMEKKITLPQVESPKEEAMSPVSPKEEISPKKITQADVMISESLRKCARYVGELKAALILADKIRESETHYSFIVQVAMLSFMGKAFNETPIFIDESTRLNKVMKALIATGTNKMVDPIYIGDFVPLTTEKVEEELSAIIKLSGGQPNQFAKSIQSSMKAGIIMKSIINSVTEALTTLQELKGGQPVNLIIQKFAECLGLIQGNFSIAPLVLDQLLDSEESGDFRIYAAREFKIATEHLIEQLQTALTDTADSIYK